jgi:hypothetical protein
LSDIVPFDYARLDDPPTQDILRQHAERLESLAQDTAVGLWEMGRILADAQDRLSAHGTGTFRRWIESETGLSRMTSWRLINVYRAFDRPSLGQSTFGVTALYLLAAPSTPAEAREEAVRQAQEGRPITPERARSIVKEYWAAHPSADQPEPTPEYREFEREDLLPRLHDAGVESAPQLLSGKQQELQLAPEEQRDGAESKIRQDIIDQFRAFEAGVDIDECVGEILDIMGQTSRNIGLAAQIGIVLAKGPLLLSDLTALAIQASGERVKNLEREQYLAWRRRVLRLIDSLTYSGCNLYEHLLENGQICYSLLP